jgi:hypothetical protein
MSPSAEAWYDDAAGPLVRPYALTGGRTRSDHYDLDLITLVVAVDPDRHCRIVEAEHAKVLLECAQPTSVAEVSARLDLPLAVAKVLISDLLFRGFLEFRTTTLQNLPDMEMLQKVLNGIRNL